ncbi:hypothetical protein [Roseimaritima sediminicola]|uniref:hypothetical protein n=1 Tax=Roseimaritima sediminicola TaxID=2662066 RepID=UPI0012984C06|nr:hypothetical protein [Roseimaritima sediminicola]
MTQASKLFSVLTLSVLLVPAIGCGPSGPVTTPVSGSVSYDGTPLDNGYVTFRDTDSSTPSAAGKIGADGTYTVDVIPGSKTVEITSSRDVPGKFDMSNPGVKVQLTEQFIPEDYNKQTKLTAEVGDDAMTLDFDLEAVN